MGVAVAEPIECVPALNTVLIRLDELIDTPVNGGLLAVEVKLAVTPTLVLCPSVLLIVQLGEADAVWPLLSVMLNDELAPDGLFAVAPPPDHE